jgi:prevent-host-death family protein
MTGMVSISATDFKAKCLEILDHVPQEGLVITKRGKSVARIYPERNDVLQFLGSIPELIVHGDILSTGESWNAESGNC